MRRCQAIESDLGLIFLIFSILDSYHEDTELILKVTLTCKIYALSCFLIYLPPITCLLVILLIISDQHL